MDEKEVMDEFANVVVLDGFEDALVGFSRRPTQPIVAVYDGDMIAMILQKRDGMTEDEAIEYISYNMLGLWVGETTPVIYFDIDWSLVRVEEPTSDEQ